MISIPYNNRIRSSSPLLIPIIFHFHVARTVRRPHALKDNFSENSFGLCGKGRKEKGQKVAAEYSVIVVLCIVIYLLASSRFPSSFGIVPLNQFPSRSNVSDKNRRKEIKRKAYKLMSSDAMCHIQS